MKYLIAGLGNVGAEYENTRHNVGFLVADTLVDELKGSFKTDRLAFVANVKYRGKNLVVIKPTTYMNLSGKAIKYWLDKENIPLQNLLVILDDLALPLGTLRMKKKGGDAGHNGLTDIIMKLGTETFPRLRIGIGNDFPRGRQVDYVLGTWSKQEMDILSPKIETAVQMIQSFVHQGIDRTMNLYNNK